MSLATWRCPKCGTERREPRASLEIKHPCKQAGAKTGQSRFVALELVPDEESAA